MGNLHIILKFKVDTNMSSVSPRKIIEQGGMCKHDKGMHLSMPPLAGSGVMLPQKHLNFRFSEVDVGTVGHNPVSFCH